MTDNQPPDGGYSTTWPDSLGPMPEAVREYEEYRTRHRPGPTLQRKADAAIAALADKLAKSVEWGRIEQKRKQEAEEREHDAIVRAEQAEARAKALEDMAARYEWLSDNDPNAVAYVDEVFEGGTG